MSDRSFPRQPQWITILRLQTTALGTSTLLTDSSWRSWARTASNTLGYLSWRTSAAQQHWWEQWQARLRKHWIGSMIQPPFLGSSAWWHRHFGTFAVLRANPVVGAIFAHGHAGQSAAEWHEIRRACMSLMPWIESNRCPWANFVVLEPTWRI